LCGLLLASFDLALLPLLLRRTVKENLSENTFKYLNETIGMKLPQAQAVKCLFVSQSVINHQTKSSNLTETQTSVTPDFKGLPTIPPPQKQTYRKTT
jgi:hypothetical protein